MKIIRACTGAQSVGFFSGMIPELRRRGFEVVSVSSEGPELSKVSEAGGRVVTVNMERHISPLRDLRSLWQLRRVFRRERPDIVHSMTPKAGLLCMMAARIARVPLRIHTFTGLVFPTAKGLTQKILMTTDRITCACATHVIPEGEGVKADLAGFGITRKPMRVLGHGNVRGIDMRRFDPDDPDVTAQAGRLRKPGVTTFIFIGRLVGDKGINELVEAFSRLYRECPDTRLLLVGPREDALDPLSPATVEEIERNEAIVTPGSQQDVRPWLAASDILAFPSYREGFPNVVIEAGAMRLPSIVTDINGSREIIRHGENGLIIPPRDADSLYEAMKRLLADGDMRRRMSEAARPLIASRYDHLYVRDCLMQFYEGIII